MDTPDITIRPATIDDSPQMLGLVRELAAFERAPDAVTVTLEHFTDSGFGLQPVWWAHVAEVNGEVVGMALWYIRFSTWKGQRMYLEDLYVQDACRGMGIGSLLMDALIADARSKRLEAICWQVLDWNTPAIDFYKRYNAVFDGEWVNVSIGV